MTRKSIIPVILAFLFCAANLHAQKKQKLSPNATYMLADDGTLYIEGSGAIPDFTSDKSLFQAKLKNKEVKRIVIGEGITSIGSYAFSHYYKTRPKNASSVIEVSLPSSLEEIGHDAFSITDISTVLPPGIKKIGEFAFSNSINAPSFEIPAGAIVEKHAFNRCIIGKLIINDNCKIGIRSFNANSSVAILADEPSISEIVFPGTGAVSLGDYCFQGQDSIRMVYLASDNDDLVKRLKRLIPNNAVISTPSLRAEAEARQKGVNAYIDFKIPSWDGFLIERLSYLEAASPEEAKALIEKKISDWQVKGEFETLSQWQKRVNEKTRAQMAKKLSNEYNTTLQKTVDKAKKDYADMRRKAADEYYAPMIEKNKERYKDVKMTLKPYDAENQTFLISSPSFGDILLPVPLADAATFKKDWKIISGSAEFEFAPVSETEVGLSKVTFFGNYPKKYVYDGKTSAQYALTDINYNFTPLQLSDGDLAQISVVDINAPTSGTTVTTSAPIKKQTAAPERRTVNAGNGDASAKPAPVSTTPKKSSVIDSNIPAGTSTRTNTFALIIANENYSRTSAVPYAINDGAVLKKYLNKTLGLPEKNILIANNATLNDIRYNLKRLSDVCEAFNGDADIIVYYAGHGVPDENSRDAYLLPVDGYPDDAASGMSLNELTNSLAALPTRHATLLLDACFSGAGREGDMLAQARGVAIKARPADGKRRLVVFSASQGTETAHPYDDEGHGLFTFFLLKKLNETKGNVTLGELADYISDNVRRTSAIEGKVQTPSVSASAENSDWKAVKF